MLLQLFLPLTLAASAYAVFFIQGVAKSRFALRSRPPEPNALIGISKSRKQPIKKIVFHKVKIFINAKAISKKKLLRTHGL